MSKRKIMESLARSVEEKKNAIYFTENHPNEGIDDSLWGYKYFLLYKNTFEIFRKYSCTARSNRRYDGNFKRRIKRSVEK